MHTHDKVSIFSEGLPRIALIGNPNVGKSVIFNRLTGRYVTVSNYPGTTVEVSRGEGSLGKKKYTIIDTPGVNSLIPMSEDEEVTRNVLLDEDICAAILIADSKALGRAALLATQLAEMGVGFVLTLNMWDEARERRIFIDANRLSRVLGVRVVPTIAVEGWGMDRLVSAVVEVERKREGSGALAGRTESGACAGTRSLEIRYDDEIERAIEAVARLMPQSRISARAHAVMMISGDMTLMQWLKARASHEKCSVMDEIVRNVAGRYSEPIGFAMMTQRMAQVNGIVAECVRIEAAPRKGVREFFERLTLNSVWGVAILLAVLVVMYFFVGKFGAGVCVDFLEGVVFEEHVNAWVQWALNKAVGWAITQAGAYESGLGYVFFTAMSWLMSFLADMIGGQYGVVTMALTYAIAIVLPIVTTFFLFFGLLEDSGYLPRLAAMADRVMRLVGLNGKAVLPMVLGLGCGTMATLVVRTLETRRQRLIATFLLALGVPCSAQLGIIMGVLVPMGGGAFAIWLGVVFATLVVAGALARRVVRGEESPFIMELPPLRVPKISNVVAKVWARLGWYAREAIPLFVLATLVLFFLDILGALGFVESLGSPVVVKLLGLPAKVTGMFMMGFLRRDYAAAGLEDMVRGGELTGVQVVVSMVTLTLFIPCVAQFFVMMRERGRKVAVVIVVLNLLIAITVGGVLNLSLRGLGVSF